MISGSLPPGVRLTRAGYLTGVPTKIGSFWFAVRAANGCSKATRWMELKVTGAPILQISTDRVRFIADDGPIRPQTVRVSASWPSLEYQAFVRTGKEWLKAVPRRGATAKPGDALDADVVELTVDPKGLKAGFYRGEVVVSAWSALDAPVIRVEFVVGRGEAGAATASPSDNPTSTSRHASSKSENLTRGLRLRAMPDPFFAPATQ